MNQFTIMQRLPSLNEIIEANRRNRYAGARQKRKYQSMIGGYIQGALIQKTLRKPTRPVILNIEFHERTKKRDADNIIAGGVKFILDSLVEQGVLIDDSRKYVRGYTAKVIDDKEDFIKVELIEEEGAVLID